MIVTLPVRTGRGQNNREHWGKASKRARMERGTACMLVKSKLWGWDAKYCDPLVYDWRFVVTLTRLSAGKLDAHDNLRGALKHVVDGVADALQLKDNDRRVRWRYRQEACKRGQFGVRIEIIPMRSGESP